VSIKNQYFFLVRLSDFCILSQTRLTLDGLELHHLNYNICKDDLTQIFMYMEKREVSYSEKDIVFIKRSFFMMYKNVFGL